VLVAVTAASLAADDRINLADFARVVRYEGRSPETLEVRAIEQGPDGWPAWQGEDGQYMIGVEWDEPREVAEVNIEFRHAIANREEIQVQYWQDHWPSVKRCGWAPLDDPFHGRWVTAQWEWWAGDRDVSLAFVPYNQEQPGDNAPGVGYRRTYRLRFLCGRSELPPVRHLRAYGPDKPAEASFDIRLDQDRRLTPPLVVSAVNGYVLGDDGSTTMPSARLDDAPASIRVRYHEGALETASRTVVTIREHRDSSRGLSFLPAEAVKYGIIRIPCLGVVIAHRGSSKDLQAGLEPGMSIFDRVAGVPEQSFARARREIPELRKTSQQPRPLYLPLGPPAARQELAVRYDGSILLQRRALKVPAGDSDRLRWPADDWLVRLGTGEPAFDHVSEGEVKQALLDGFLPIVINTWQQGVIRYQQTCVAAYLDREPPEPRGDETVVLLARLAMANTGSAPATASAGLRIDPVEQLALNAGHVVAEGLLRAGEVERYDEPRYRFFFKGVHQQDLEPAGGPAANAAGAIRWHRELLPGQAGAIEWAVPFVTIDSEAELERIAALDFDHVLQREAGRWRKIIDRAAAIEVPDPLLNDFYKAQLTHLLITADRDPYTGMHVLPAATFAYGVCLNESCHQIRALEIRGLHDEARRFLDAFIKGQSSRGLHGRFSDKQGVLHGLPSKHGDYQTFNYNLDHGFALWMLNEHYRFTRDRDWLAGSADALIAACDFVTRQRSKPGSHTLAPDDTGWGLGLLPPGHLEDPPEWLWWFAVNAYAYRGMQATAESLAEINHPQAARIAREAQAFGSDLRRCCKESMVRAPVVRLRDGTYVPHQPTRSRLRQRDLGWIRDGLYGPVHLIDCGIYAHDSPQAEWILRDTEDNVFVSPARGRKLGDFDREWFSWGGITLQSNLLPTPLIYVRRGQAKHAIRAFFNSLAANIYADVCTFCEHPIEAYGIGLGPFFKSPDESAFIVWLRHLLIAECGKDLALLAGVPGSWLSSGRRITIERAATWFGPMDMRVESGENPRRITVQLTAPQRNLPRTIRLHLLRDQPIKAVTVNARAVSTFDPKTGVVNLPGSIGQAMIVASY